MPAGRTPLGSTSACDCAPTKRTPSCAKLAVGAVAAAAGTPPEGALAAKPLPLASRHCATAAAPGDAATTAEADEPESSQSMGAGSDAGSATARESALAAKG